MYNVPEHLRST